ncbi:hypothetical protein ACIOHS_26955 [Streptomyces sp. NPDC088253]
MSAADEQNKARKAYAAGKQQRADGKLGDRLARANGGASAQGGGAR